MIYLFLMFALVAALHFLSLKVQAQYSFYTKTFGMYGLQIHFLITGLLWTILIVVFIFTDKTSYPVVSFFNFYLFKPIGYLLSLLGITLILWSGYLLGLKRAWGIRFFDENYKTKIEKRGPYMFLTHPIYDGFFIYFLGKSLATNSLFYLILGIESYILLNVFLARFENQDFINKIKSETNRPS